jgi:hypothetical protein
MRSLGVADAADEIERLLRLIGRAASNLSKMQSENRRLRSLCGLPVFGKLPELES